jgi:hypothetical protein
LITEDTAQLFASKRGHVTRGIDALKKSRGENTSSIIDLHMTPTMEKKGPPSIPATLKIK